MKDIFPILLLSFLVLFSCNSFDEDRAIEDQDTLLEILDIAQKNGLKRSDANANDILSNKLRWNRIDQFEIIYQSKHHMMGIDSLAIFIRRSSNILTLEKRIIYDFAKTPRNEGNDDLPNASYKRTQVAERWYYETEGFD